jgi:type III secretion protein U
MSHFLVDTFNQIANQNLLTMLGALWEQAVMVIFIISIPVLLVVSAIGVIITFLTVGPVFSTEVFKFDIKKFDPVQNLKSKFKLKTLV